MKSFTSLHFPDVFLCSDQSLANRELLWPIGRSCLFTGLACPSFNPNSCINPAMCIMLSTGKEKGESEDQDQKQESKPESKKEESKPKSESKDQGKGSKADLNLTERPPREEEKPKPKQSPAKVTFSREEQNRSTPSLNTRI